MQFTALPDHKPAKTFYGIHSDCKQILVSGISIGAESGNGFILFFLFCDFNFETTVVLPTARPPANHLHSLICIGTCAPLPINTLPQYSQ